jgi:hypothetical protein
MSDATYVWPGHSDINLVRWYLGDTATSSSEEVADPLVTDLEITFALQQKSNDAKAAAAFCARYASVKLLRGDAQSVRLLDFSASGMTSAKDAADYYLKLAERLEREDQRAGIYAGGISVSEKEANRSDTDIAQPAFRRGMHDYNGSSD